MFLCWYPPGLIAPIAAAKSMQYTLSQLNRMSQSEFTETLGAIFEDSPWVAQEAWLKRPFADLDSLHQGMVGVVQGARADEQLTLIRLHPDLGNKAKMSESSVKEQTGAGLSELTPQEYERFQSLNNAYKNRFGFPFIVAVKNHTKDSILEAFEHRLNNLVDREKTQAIAEIAKIARFRLEEIIRD